MKICALVLVTIACSATPPREAAPEALPSVPAPPLPDSIDGTYELEDPSMHMTLVLDEFGAVKLTKQTAFMRRPEESRGHWRKEGDAVIYLIDADETTCTRSSDRLVCGRLVFRRR